MSIVRIYCMAHKKYEKLNNDIYIPLQVGAALHNSLGYHSDNTGDNISERNPYYSELTGLYWLYKKKSFHAIYLLLQVLTIYIDPIFYSILHPIAFQANYLY